MYKHILIATDGSELAGKAVRHGLALAKDQKASATLITVSENWPTIDLGVMSHYADQAVIDAFEKAVAESAAATLADAAAAAKSAGVTSHGEHVTGAQPAEAIVAAAKARGCDLIVMASHGRRGLNRALLGSQTSEVLALSEVPVLVVR
jgi:nucleotide-binding universal stress UspA family protein